MYLHFTDGEAEVLRGEETRLKFNQLNSKAGLTDPESIFLLTMNAL